MTRASLQPRLIGFAGQADVSNPDELRLALREELSAMRECFGPRITAISGIGKGADLVFLRVCVELRIPMILISPRSSERLSEAFDDPDEWTLVRHLISVALAKYVVPEPENGMDTAQAVAGNLLAFADAFLLAWRGEGDFVGEMIAETRALGIPARIIHTKELHAHWSFDPDLKRGARHGFETRKELLEFFDARLPTLFP